MASIRITTKRRAKNHEARSGPQAKSEELELTRATTRKTHLPTESTVMNGHRTLATKVRTIMSNMTHLTQGAFTMHEIPDTHHLRRGHNGTTNTKQHGTNGPPQYQQQ